MQKVNTKGSERKNSEMKNMSCRAAKIKIIEQQIFLYIVQFRLSVFRHYIVVTVTIDDCVTTKLANQHTAWVTHTPITPGTRPQGSAVKSDNTRLDCRLNIHKAETDNEMFCYSDG